MLLQKLKLTLLLYCLKEWSFLTKTIFVNCLVIFSYQISVYIFFTFSINMIALYGMSSKLREIYIKNLVKLLSKNSWTVSAENLYLSLIDEHIDKASFLFYFDLTKQSTFVLEHRLSLNENCEKLKFVFKNEKEENKWKYVIESREEDKYKLVQNLFGLNHFWDLSLIESRFSHSIIKILKDNEWISEVVDQNIKMEKIRFLVSLDFSNEEIKELYGRIPGTLIRYQEFINTVSSDELVKIATGKKRTTYLKNKIKEGISINCENTLKILNFVYLFDLNIDIALPWFCETSKNIVPEYSMLDYKMKRNCSLTKRILKKQYSDKKILELLMSASCKKLLSSNLKSMIYLMPNKFPSKVKKFEDFSEHQQFIQALSLWKWLKIPTSKLEKKIPESIEIDGNHYKFHFPKTIKDFYNVGSSLGNCLYTHDYFCKGYGGFNQVFVLTEMDGKTPFVAVEVDRHGLIVQCKGKKDLNDSILESKANYELSKLIPELWTSQHFIILLLNYLFRKNILFFKWILFLIEVRITFFINFIRILL